jgi:hypothetical protein
MRYNWKLTEALAKSKSDVLEKELSAVKVKMAEKLQMINRTCIYSVQFSIRRPSTRSNSFILLVTRISPWLRA